jgi:hypothetical protein
MLLPVYVHVNGCQHGTGIYNNYWMLISRVADPDPHGSALFLVAGSGSALVLKADLDLDPY